MKQKSMIETTLDKDQMNIQNGLSPTRRELLIWTAPVVAAISLPVHAQTSACRVPAIRAVTPAKCAGENPQGEATLEIYSVDPMDPTISEVVNIISVTDDAVEPNVIAYSATSGPVDGSGGIDISWNGPSSDATTCLPDVNVTFTITYNCEAVPDQEVIMVTLIDELEKVVP